MSLICEGWDELRDIWDSHGTKLLGVIVFLIGLLSAISNPVHELLGPRGDAVYDIVRATLDYCFIGAGAAVIRRGFTNSAPK